MDIHTAIISTTPGTHNQSVTQSSGVVIDIQPSEDNVEIGDRSSNTAEVSITTPSREASRSVSREQAIDGLDRRLQRQVINQLNTSQGISQFALRALQQIDTNFEDISEVSTLLHQRELANTYLNASSANSLPNTSNPDNTAGNNGAAIYNNAVNAYIKQTLLFSTLESASSRFSTTA